MATEYARGTVAVLEKEGFTLTEYPERAKLNNEVHSRPFVGMKSPCRVTNIAVLHDGSTLDDEIAHIRRLCDHFGQSMAEEALNHLILDFGTFQLKWERHTEFSSYTFLRDGAGQAPFKDTALSVIPGKWLSALPGQMLVGVHLQMASCKKSKCYNPDELQDIFGSNSVVGAFMSGSAATAWTDFRLHGDGFSRILINNISMQERQAGRLLQRLWEIETYRMMSLLAMPMANRVGRKTRAIEQKLADNVSQMANVQDPAQEQALLETLTKLASQVEELSAETSFRFMASKAYYALVLKRLENIKETSIDGVQRMSSFVDRRLAPAMRTVESMDDRIAVLSRRVNRASNLLQTRINTTLQAQNKELLKSMDRRAHLQLRLQETVEGLSVVAISYYALGIVSILAKAAAKQWPLLEPTYVTAAAAPIVIGLVFFSIRRMRKALMKD